MPIDITVGRSDETALDQRLEETVSRAAAATLVDRGVSAAEISFTLMDDPAMAAMNRQWKGREGPTDVLAFPLHEEGEGVVGDIYLGVEQVRRQAGELGENPDRELARVAIHGTLHVLGWDHPDEDREESEMWRVQEEILAKVSTQ